MKIGTYRHFKGGLAEVKGTALHSETQEEYVIYTHPSKETGTIETWIRPVKMFLEEVEVHGKKVPRFEYVGE